MNGDPNYKIPKLVDQKLNKIDTNQQKNDQKNKVIIETCENANSAENNSKVDNVKIEIKETKPSTNFLYEVKVDIDKLQKDLNLNVNNKCEAKGRSALIYYAEKNRNYFAVKVIYKNKSETHEEKKKVKQEMLIASNVKFKYCIRCVATSDQQYSRILILERCINKDLNYVINLFYSSKLFQFLRFKKSDLSGKLKNNFMFWLSESFCRFFFIQILSAIEYLHSLYYVHGDIQLNNILLMLNFDCKLTDYAETRAVSSSKDFKTFCPPNRNYTAPECYYEGKLIPSRQAFKIDTYALTVLLYKMIFNQFIIEEPVKDQLNTEENKKNSILNIQQNITNISIENNNFSNSIEKPKEIIKDDRVNKEQSRIVEGDINNTTQQNIISENKVTPKEITPNSKEPINELQKLQEKLKKLYEDNFSIPDGRPKENVSKELVDLFKKGLDFDFFKRAGSNEISHMKWTKKNTLQLKKMHEIHDNDYIKFLLELQKMDSVRYYQNKQNCFYEKLPKDERMKVEYISLKNKLTEPNLLKKRNRCQISEGRSSNPLSKIKSKIRIL